MTFADARVYKKPTRDLVARRSAIASLWELLFGIGVD